jgi:hypothetical protein
VVQLIPPPPSAWNPPPPVELKKNLKKKKQIKYPNKWGTPVSHFFYKMAAGGGGAGGGEGEAERKMQRGKCNTRQNIHPSVRPFIHPSIEKGACIIHRKGCLCVHQLTLFCAFQPKNINFMHNMFWVYMWHLCFPICGLLFILENNLPYSLGTGHDHDTFHLQYSSVAAYL